MNWVDTAGEQFFEAAARASARTRRGCGGIDAGGGRCCLERRGSPERGGRRHRLGLAECGRKIEWGQAVVRYKIHGAFHKC
jgi:hypothetical protein